ncbi:MAG: hypothetical protein IPH94_15910 [Saprospiraceae bacterium]|nr:hypothetical protein [Saprospiraceae bacterium]
MNCTQGDTLIFSYLGYFSMVLSVDEVKKGSKILLNPDTQLIEDVVVYADDDYLYEWLTQCRSRLKEENKPSPSKAYLVVETICNGQPVEFLEAYYNAILGMDGIRDLGFKNGRSYLAPHNYGGYFFNFDFSHSLSLYSLLDGQGLFPENPLQFGKSKMKKKFRLERGPNRGTLTTIRFYPRKEEGELFSGEIIFNKEKFEIIDIWLLAPPQGQRVFKAFGDSVLDSLHYSANFHLPVRLLVHQHRLQSKLTSRHHLLDSLAEREVAQHRFPCCFALIRPRPSVFVAVFDYRAGLSDYRLFVVPPADSAVWSCLRYDNHIGLSPARIL